MSRACADFRAALARALERVPAGDAAAAAGELGWHEHVRGCAACRELLEEERALDLLLASLPEPALPPALARRVLARLAGARGPDEARALDQLLAFDAAPDFPQGLGERVLAGLASARRADDDARLDDLLGAVPAPRPPAHLAARVLSGLERERRPRFPLLRSPRARALAFAAAAALVVLALLLRERGAPAPEPPPLVQDAPARDARRDGRRTLAHVEWTDNGSQIRQDEVRRADPARRAAPVDGVQRAALPDAELLASLDVLEDWDLLMSEDVDLLLASLDAADELLLELREPDAQPDGG